MSAAAAPAATDAARRTGLTLRPLRRRDALQAIVLALAGTVALPVSAWAQTAGVAAASPVALAIRDEVGGKLKQFYRARGYWPLWIKGDAPGPQAAALVDVIESVRVDGLDPDRYDPARLRRAIDEAGGDPKALARLELRLSETLADLVRDMREPQLDIRYLDRELEPQRIAPAEALRRAALAPSLPDYVASLGWMSPLYTRLRTALEGDSGGGEISVPVAPGPLLKPGMRGTRVAVLRRRLGLDDGDAYDAALAARVRALQAARGMPADGVAGARTLAALNASNPAPDRHDLLRRNLERARLLPDAYTRHIVVDAASARLWYFGDGSEQGTMKVVVGTPETPTPMMAGVVRYATLNPYWNVPVDLVRKRIAPKMLKGATLRSQGYEALSDWTADAQVIDAATIDWHGVENGSVEPRVRELPGRGNSMGSVKFTFPNDQGIYLHDTNDRALFAKPDRHFSNGCIRLEDAPRLGRFFFGHALKADGAAPEQHVPLPQPVPVYLMYFTASPGADGIAYPPDRYARDGRHDDRIASR